MQEHKNYFPDIQELSEYTLFLDRDGVINTPCPDDYIKEASAFEFNTGAVKALAILRKCIKQIFIVTNQQGIGRGLMREEDLENIHLKMYNTFKENKIAWFDGLFFAPYLRSDQHPWRKPSAGMADKAKSYFPLVDTQKSILVGDSPGDMELAAKIGAIKVKISNPQFEFDNHDFEFGGLSEFADFITKI